MLHDFKPSDDGLDKAQRKAEIRRLREKLAAQQQSVMAAKLPVVVLVEGWDCAGKGHLINELISEMDPRFYRVAVYKRVPENEERYPFLRKFFEPLPENGLYSNAMAGTDRMELYLTVNAAGDQMMLVSLFDNLGKGSSGAAVQCMNLMLGLEETKGLE